MRVLVAGATGAIGVPTVRALVSGGHEVVGTTRRADKTSLIEGMGATAQLMDALDLDSVRRAIEQVRPEAIVQLLTAIPTNGPTRVSHLNGTNLLRTSGTHNLLEVASAVGVRRYVSESIVIVYGSGDRVFTEDDPYVSPASVPGDRNSEPIRAVISLEGQMKHASPIEAVVLRFGLFYGPESGSTRFMQRMARRRMLWLPRGKGIVPWIHLDDAASAVVAALERGRAGEAYNVVDDRPVSLWEFAQELASAIHAPGPKRLPRWLARLAIPYVVDGLDTQLRVANDKAKRELGWSPRYPTVADGLRVAPA